MAARSGLLTVAPLTGGGDMKRPTLKSRIAAAIALGVVATAGARGAMAALPPGNTVSQWNQIAEDTVVGSGAFLPEGFVYMAYASAAVYDAVIAIEGGYEPYGPAIVA